MTGGVNGMFGELEVTSFETTAEPYDLVRWSIVKPGGASYHVRDLWLVVPQDRRLFGIGQVEVRKYVPLPFPTSREPTTHEGNP